MLFPDKSPLKAVTIDILGPLPSRKQGFVFMLVISDLFNKLTHDVPRITTYDVSVAFTQWTRYFQKMGPSPSRTFFNAFAKHSR